MDVHLINLKCATFVKCATKSRNYRESGHKSELTTCSVQSVSKLLHLHLIELVKSFRHHTNFMNLYSASQMRFTNTRPQHRELRTLLFTISVWVF